MSVSSPGSLFYLCETLVASNKEGSTPRFSSMLDVGCGIGQHGLAMRSFGYLWHHGDDPPLVAWHALKVDAIDINEQTILDHHRHIYNKIMIGSALDWCKHIDEYDLIYFGDCIEHMWEPEAKDVLRALWSKTTDLLLLAVPVSQGVAHETQVKYGGPCGGHISAWNPGKIAEQIRSCADVPVSIQFLKAFEQYMVWCWKKHPFDMSGRQVVATNV